MNFLSTLKSIRRLALIACCALPAVAATAPQRTFATPDAAVDALLAALEVDDDAALLAIFGEQHRTLIVTPDKAMTSANRARAATALQTYRLLEERGDDRRVLLIGDQAWPVPIPLVRTDGQWRFATEEGVEEIVNRRIGANERSTILVMRAYLDAQKDYATRDRDGDGVLEYAQRIASTTGKQDGLYWPTETGQDQEPSPFGPLIAQSAAYLEGHRVGDAYRGYVFRILTRQGSHAAGGEHTYVINGNMIAGFAMVAYPARYGDSGVMTFIVSHNGKIFEKNLGKSATALAKHAAYNPGPGWKEVAAQ
jgi:hypothetical protein